MGRVASRSCTERTALEPSPTAAATRFIEAQLFGVAPTDLLTMTAATLGIVAVASLSGYFPARRATTIDPVRALHWE